MESERTVEQQLVGEGAALTGWTLTRIEIRTAISGNKWPVARVELDHVTRGRVTDIATAPGAFEAVFKAASQIVGIDPRLLTYNVSAAGFRKDRSLAIRVDIELELDGKIYRGSNAGSDLVRSSLLAWLAAAAKGVAGMDGTKRCAARPFQVSAIDENDDLWIFASSDQGAAEAIEQEFRGDGHSEVRLLV